MTSQFIVSKGIKMYCVYLTEYLGDKMPRYYVGSSSVKKIEEGYKGSVSSKLYKDVWHKELQDNPNLFQTNILTIHDTRKEATHNELLYQIQNDVVNNQKYINRSLARVDGFFGMDVSGKLNPMYGSNRMGEKHKGGNNISKALKLYYSTENGLKMRAQHSKNMIGCNNPMFQKHHTEDFKNKQSIRMTGKNNPMYGKTQSKKNKQNQSERMCGENNPSCKLRKKYEVNGIIIENAKLFCENNGLAYTNFIKCADSDRTYKGYIVKRIIK